MGLGQQLSRPLGGLTLTHPVAGLRHILHDDRKPFWHNQKEDSKMRRNNDSFLIFRHLHWLSL